MLSLFLSKWFSFSCSCLFLTPVCVYSVSHAWLGWTCYRSSSVVSLKTLQPFTWSTQPLQSFISRHLYFFNCIPAAWLINPMKAEKWKMHFLCTHTNTQIKSNGYRLHYSIPFLLTELSKPFQEKVEVLLRQFKKKAQLNCCIGHCFPTRTPNSSHFYHYLTR